MAKLAVTRSLAVAALALAYALSAPGAATASTPSNWMVSAQAIALVNGYEGNSSLTTSAFDTPSTIDIGSPAAGWVAQRAATFTFYGPSSKTSSFLYAVKHGLIPAGTKYVMLDLESWSLTPHSEQVTPKVYMRQFVSAAHADGYLAVLAPAIDLSTGMTCNKTTEPAWEDYLVSCSVPSLVAAAAPDVYEIQSQSLEADTSAGSGCGCFEWFVDQSAAQARVLQPSLDVRAGLSTNPSGHVSSGKTLYTDTLDTDTTVDGYWLNVPTKGTACPSCVAGGAPQVAVDYLELLGYTA